MRNPGELEEKIGYSFNDEDILLNALTHSSYTNENRNSGAADNERLEFFGDAIIEFFVSEYLFEKYTDLPEGQLTRMRAAIVCESGLYVCAKEIELGSFIRMGKGEESTGGRDRPSITSDAFEALTAAIYLDGGREAAGVFIRKHILECLEDKDLFYDAKTRLQEFIQTDSSNILEYKLLDEQGPVHDRTFIEAAYLNGREIGRGSGRSKKYAQQEAARAALKNLKS